MTIIHVLYAFLFNFLLSNVLVALIQNSYAEVVNNHDVWDCRLKLYLIVEGIQLRLIRQARLPCCGKKAPSRLKNYPYVFIGKQTETGGDDEEGNIDNILDDGFDLIENIKGQTTLFKDFDSNIHGFKYDTHLKITEVINKLKGIEATYNKLEFVDQFKDIRKEIRSGLQKQHDKLRDEIINLKAESKDIQEKHHNLMVNKSTLSMSGVEKKTISLEKRQVLESLNQGLAAVEGKIK